MLDLTSRLHKHVCLVEVQQNSIKRWLDIWAKIYAGFITTEGLMSRLYQEQPGKGAGNPAEKWSENRNRPRTCADKEMRGPQFLTRVRQITTKHHFIVDKETLAGLSNTTWWYLGRLSRCIPRDTGVQPQRCTHVVQRRGVVVSGQQRAPRREMDHAVWGMTAIQPIQWQKQCTAFPCTSTNNSTRFAYKKKR